MSRKAVVSILLILALLAGLVAGCGGGPAPQTGSSASAAETPESSGAAPGTEAPGTAAPGTPASAEPNPDLPTISWATAFHDSSVPEGALSADCVAFLRKRGDGKQEVFNVLREEIYANPPERLPRTHFFEQFMPQEMIDELLPVLDYAVVNSCSRFCLPASSVSYKMIRQASRYLSYSYDVNDKCRIDPLPVGTFTREEGTLSFLMISILGMENGGSVDHYRQGLAAAQAVVDAMPQGLDERGKMLYLYKYLCDNVRYNYGLYYEWNEASLLYDAMVLHSTVCAGYAEALFVLSSLAGIDGFILTGEVGALGEENDLHAWNVARIDGQYYEFDATWDEGLSPADYQYFGASEEFCAKYHTRLMRSFEQEVIPPRPENLLPETPDPEDSDDPVFAILWYFRLRNARDYNPKALFPYFGYGEDEILAGEPRDGWVRTKVPLEEFYSRLLMVLSEAQRAELFGDCLKDDGQGHVMYRVPEEELPLLRLVGAEENEDGSWTASLLEMRADGGTASLEMRITLQRYGGRWVVDAVE